MRRLVALIGQEAAFGWRVAPATAAAVFLLPLVGAIAVAVSSRDRPLFELLTGTQSPLDWSRFAAFGLAAALGAAVVQRMWRAGRPRDVLLYVALGAVCVAVASEQRTVPHLGTAAILLAGAFGTIAPWLVWRRRRGQTTEVMRLTVPPLFLTPGFFLAFASQTIGLLTVRHPEPAIATFGEWSEMWLALSLMAFVLLTHQRLRRAYTPVLPLACGGHGWASVRGRG